MTEKESSDQALAALRGKNWPLARKLYKQLLESDQSCYRYRNVNSYLTALTHCYETDEDAEIYKQFTTSFIEYAEIAKSRDTKTDAENILESLIEYALENILRFAIREKTEFHRQRMIILDEIHRLLPPFIEALTLEPIRPKSFFFDTFLAKTYKERVNFERKGITYQNVFNTKILAEAFLELTQDNKEMGRRRSNVFLLLSEIIFNDPEKIKEDPLFLTQEAVKYLDKSLEELGENLFAKKRKDQLNDNITIQEQLHSFQHDVNSKMSTMSSLTDALQRQYPENDEIRKIVRTMEDMRSVLDLSQNKTPHPETVDIVALMEEIRSERKELVAIKLLGQPLEWKYSNRGFLKIILENLIKNSLEAYERHAISLPQPAILITVDFENHSISVEDQAGGIPENLLHNNKLFEIYVSEKGIAQNHGRGLAHVKDACEKLEMEIILDSQRNKAENTGTTKFTIKRK
jgi:signal transduction histidine kinase